MRLTNVGKRCGEGSAGRDILRGVDLAIRDGEFLAIVGCSGTGKSTLVSLLAGLEAPTAGTIEFDGESVTSPDPRRGVVFQNYSLMPWLTVTQNVALAVDAIFAERPRAWRRDRVAHYIERVGLSAAKDRRPTQLSGGMRQRVALARALAAGPKMLLLDEPLSALDALTRARLQDELAALREREHTTLVLITNDVDEAILLADRIVTLEAGERGATLGMSFDVTLPRPRHRSAINDDAAFRRLRHDVTRRLLDSRRTVMPAGRNDAPALPAVSPIEARPRARAAQRSSSPSSPPSVPAASLTPPRAYLDAAATRPMNAFIEFFQVRKTFETPAGPLTVVDGFDLRMRKGELVTLIGHSGCGKSTVLSMIAGLTEVSGGGIVLDGREVTGAGPDRGVVFQAPNLFPWMTATENVSLGVDRVYPHASRAERQDIVRYYLARVGLAAEADRLARDLSNGQRQRVGIARAFALSPKLLLLDEPFGMLDALTRWDLQTLLLEVWARTQVTAICVTHDVDEAILLADRVVMMTNGPNARIGHVMEVCLPRPRSRQALLEHPDYYRYRRELLDFLGRSE